MAFSTEELKEHLRWKNEMLSAISYCETLKALDTLEQVKALILYADRQVEARKKGKCEWIRVGMRKRLNEKELAVRRRYEAELYKLKERPEVRLWSDGALHA